MRSLRGLWVAICLMPLIQSPVMAGEVYTTFLVEGKAPITIDGDLSDWQGLDLEAGVIDNFIPWPNTSPPVGKDDLSAVFKCFADQDNLYVAVWVTDDRLVFGEEDFFKRWNDDSIEIFFDGDLVNTGKRGYDSNDGQIRITVENGRTVFERAAGIISGVKRSGYPDAYPYMWESLGVVASLGVSNAGYVVEVRIPKEVLGLEDFSQGIQIGLNIRVMDDDDGGQVDSILDWANDKENLSCISTINFKQVSIDKVVESPVTEGEGSGPLVVGGGSELEVVIGDGRFVVYEVLGDLLEGGDYSSAIAKLSGIGSETGVLPLLGMVEQEAGRHSDAVGTFERFIERSSTKAGVWGKERIAVSYQELGEYGRAIEWYNQILGLVDSGSYMAECAVMGIAECWVELEGYDKAVEVYEEALQKRAQPNPHLLMALGDVYRRHHQHQEAVDEYTKVLAIPDTPQNLWRHIT